MGTRMLLMTLALATALVGCGSRSTTYVGPSGEKVTTDSQGNVKVTDEKGNTTDIKAGGETYSAKSSDGSEVNVSKEGMSGKNEKGETFSVGTSEVSESELGLPLYPGSISLIGRDMKADANGVKTFVSARSTSDAPAKVIEFYKAKLKETSTSSSDTTSVLTGKLEDGRKVGVLANVVDGRTEVQVTVTDK